ncbi:excalibur calcium-binding domain-containing protein [Streptomyces sp. NPDC048357]|uniref:excalibur calcium-binding domain-containing protein n=1 Tax=Streptomyces sp. NPDC048357 TaxID=3154719 RepID=UPI00341C24F9
MLSGLWFLIVLFSGGDDKAADAAKAAGAAPIRKGQPGYRSALDKDGDGIACDK